VVEVLGVYAVPEAREPCQLIEVAVTDAFEFDVGDFTQETPGQPRDNWQVPWDERFLNGAGDAEDPTAGAQGNVRLAFFFHDLDPARPLITPFGTVPLPEPTERPARLQWLQYEEP
jgi:hypothetical protein